MSVRCGCGQVVSEWAARCPACRADVTQFALLPEPEPEPAAEPSSAAEPSPETEPAPEAEPPGQVPLAAAPAGGQRPTRLRRVLPPLAAAAALVVAALVVFAPTGAHPGSSGVPLPGVVTGLGHDAIAYTSSTPPRLEAVGGRHPDLVGRPVPQVLPAGQAVRAGWGAAWVGTDGEAQFVGPAGQSFGVGPARAVVPGPGGLFGIDGPDMGYGSQAQTVQVTGSPDHPLVRVVRALALPVGARLVAVLGDGRFAVRTATNQLALWNADRVGPVLGDLGQVVGVSNTWLAWTSTDGCTPEGDCPLSLTDLRTGQRHAVAAPGWTAGYVGGGAFTADGRLLAAFAEVAPQPGEATARIRPVIVDPASESAFEASGLPHAGASTATTQAAGPAVPSALVQGQAVGLAWWSHDDAWLVYGAPAGPLMATDEATERPGTVSAALGLPSSWGVAVVGPTPRTGQPDGPGLHTVA